MWRGKDIVYNILGYLVFAMPIDMPFIVYREPRGGTTTPPPLAVRACQAYELLAKAHGVRAMVSKCWWGSCCGNATMGYINKQCKLTGLYTTNRVL